MGRGRESRWLAYALVGALGAIFLGPYLVIGLLGCGLLELFLEMRPSLPDRLNTTIVPGIPALIVLAIGTVGTIGGIGALVWEAFKVGALSYGGGFVIIPLMQHDAVTTYHWMSSAHFLNAVALGQITPGPVVATVAAVGYAAHGVVGGVIAAAVAFTPSFVAVMVGGAAFSADPRLSASSGVSGRSRSGGDRSDPRVGRAAGRRVAARLAGPGAGVRGDRAIAGPPWRGPDAARSRRRGDDRGAGRRTGVAGPTQIERPRQWRGLSLADL